MLLEKIDNKSLHAKLSHDCAIAVVVMPFKYVNGDCINKKIKK